MTLGVTKNLRTSLRSPLEAPDDGVQKMIVRRCETGPADVVLGPVQRLEVNQVFAVFDLDRTITKHGTFTAFLLSNRKNIAARVALMLRILRHMIAYKLGRIDRASLKNRMLALALHGRSREEIQQAAERFVARILETGIRDGSLSVISKHRAAGDTLVLATASIDLYASIFARHLGFDHVVCTSTAVGKCGQQLLCIPGKNCYGEEKLIRVAEVLLQNDTVTRDKIFVSAYSDDLCDLPLLEWSDAPTVVCPSLRTRLAAVARRMKVVKW
jgi:HAD superfamily hydrolase (TIGR01490 family)